MDENLEIVRKVTEDALIFAFALAAMLLAMVRRNFFGFAFMAVWLTVEVVIYLAWLLPLLPRG